MSEKLEELKKERLKLQKKAINLVFDKHINKANVKLYASLTGMMISIIIVIALVLYLTTNIHYINIILGGCIAIIVTIIIALIAYSFSK